MEQGTFVLLRFGAIILTPQGLALLGPQSRPAASGDDNIVIRELRPAHWHSWLKLDAESHADRTGPLPEEIAPQAQQMLRFALRSEPPEQRIEKIRAWFDESIGRAGRGPRHWWIARIEEAIADPDMLTAEMLCAHIGANHARLTRLCTRSFGFTPKLLLRRERFLRSFATVRHIPRGSWAGSIDLAYVDQSHFIRDAHRFLGMSPSRFLAANAPGAEARAAA